MTNNKSRVLVFVSAMILFTSQSIGAVTANTIYAETNTSLYTIDPSTGAASLIGTDTLVNLFDIAFSGSTLYGASSSGFYTVDPNTGKSTLVGNTGYRMVNALEVAADGTIYAADFITSELFTINPTTGAGTGVGSFGSVIPIGSFSGDLAFGPDGTLYGSYYSFNCGGDCLATIDPQSGIATQVGSIGYADVFGLAFRQGVLYGATNAGDVLTIDTSSGIGTLIGINGLRQQGMTVAPMEDIGAVPDIRGKYSGTYSIDVWGCSDSTMDGTYNGTLEIDIPTLNDDAFTGTAIGTLMVDGATGVEYIQLSGTIGQTGNVNGITSHTFLNTAGTGTFTGQLNQDTLTIDNSGQDTVGDICSYTRHMTATRPGSNPHKPNISWLPLLLDD